SLVESRQRTKPGPGKQSGKRVNEQEGTGKLKSKYNLPLTKRHWIEIGDTDIVCRHMDAAHAAGNFFDSFVSALLPLLMC
ncbi:MAG: hypothetical protein J7527_15230, partial [Chitinophagaceae bacterium]|nr:hypothetical protein [Chitinophagaceae bacterium]